MNKKLSCSQKRNLYSSNVNCQNNPVIPVITYNNVEDQKSLILKSNKGKAGIYR
jgi:hypothetical protein